ncbi:MAG: lysoplasmalogenase family protein [Erythrobacter sp.]|uniref:lysoplasmalogenase family protein n=1 Tax=Erythrobacter sp. TaxID=1042 RepID=UPI002610CC51|nr:lysoplasmalogenase family protein [Erythrobacter sp.]MDJ0977765.1 lysoplasmalogenase family protein [Erythrobacter sp.]
MARRALIEHRPWLAASLLAGVAYYFLWNNAIGGIWLILLKGAGVGFLAIYALRRTKGLDGAILTLALALSAAADAVLEIDFELGGVLFFASHWVAVALYLRNRKPDAARNRKLLGALLLIATPVGAYALSGDPLIGVYAISLGAMAATAWTSRFPVSRVGLGALLFIVSDWLIFSRMGPLDLAPLPDILVWPTYYAAQFMIATGVVQTLRCERMRNSVQADA